MTTAKPYSMSDTTVNLALVLRDEGRLYEALALAATLPDTGDEAWWRHDVSGGVHLFGIRPDLDRRSWPVPPGHGRSWWSRTTPSGSSTVCCCAGWSAGCGRTSDHAQ
jgi:hypothetical protein